MRGSVEHIHDPLLVDDGSEYDRDIIEWGQPLFQSLRVFLHRVAVLCEEVPFVHDKHAAFAVADDQVEYTHVLRLHAGGRVNHQDADIGMLDRPDSPHDRIELKVLVDLCLPSHPCRVDEHEIVAELVVSGRDRVAGSAGDGSHDVPFLAQKGVGQG